MRYVVWSADLTCDFKVALQFGHIFQFMFDSLFRVREKGNGSFALSISYRGTTKHYRIDRRKATSTGERLAIEDGPQFENLMDVRTIFTSRYD